MYEMGVLKLCPVKFYLDLVRTLLAKVAWIWHFDAGANFANQVIFTI
jgi:hypothetical protein